MKQILKTLYYKALNLYYKALFYAKYFVWKHTRKTSIKEYTREKFSENLIKESVKLITHQQKSNKKIYQDWVWFVGYIPHDWLDRINKKIEETKPDWVKAEENKKDG